MSYYSEKNKPIIDSVKNKAMVIDEIYEKIIGERVDFDERAKDNLARLKVMNGIILSEVERVDDYLVRGDMINNILSQMNGLYDNLNYAYNQKNNSYLHNLETILNNINTYINQLNIYPSKSSIISLTRSAGAQTKKIIEYKETINEEYSKINNEIKQLNSKISNVKLNQDNLELNINKSLTDFTEKFNNSQSKRAEEFEITKDKNKEFLEQSQDDISIKIKEQIDKNYENFTYEINKLKNVISTTEVDVNQRIEANIEVELIAYKKKADDIVVGMEKNRDDVKKLMDIITNTSISNGYKQFADSSRTAYYIFTVLTVIGFGVLILMAFDFLDTLKTIKFDWTVSLIRLATLSLIAAPITFLMRESSKHLRNANIYKKMELDMTALSPYLETIKDEEAAEKIKIEISEKMFGRFDLVEKSKVKNEKDEIGITVGNSSKLIDIIRDVMKLYNNK